MINHKTNQSGFTLLEVLITLVILAIGLLGLAGLQATGLKNNHSAYMRSQATQLAYDIADRMRANMTAVESDSYITSNPSSAAKQTTCMTAPGCDPALMAENDLYEWNLALTNSLPLVEASISILSGTHTITINWDDNRDGLVDGDDPDFQVSFQL